LGVYTGLSRRDGDELILEPSTASSAFDYVLVLAQVLAQSPSPSFYNEGRYSGGVMFSHQGFHRGALSHRIRRREFVAIGSVAAAWAIEALSEQPGRVRRIGLLADFSDAQMRPLISAFRVRLEKLGWTDENIRIDYRLAIGDSAQFQAAAATLVGLAPDVVVTQGSPALRAIRQETSVNTGSVHVRGRPGRTTVCGKSEAGRQSHRIHQL
jgi:hypothetical protein